jgi:hypothetical protein
VKPKSRTIPGQSIRNIWQIKPQTRIHDNDIRKNPQKQRQIGRKDLKSALMDREQG